MVAKPRRFVVDANDDYYVEESDGRVFALPSGGFIREQGLPVGEGVTTYTPAADFGKTAGNACLVNPCACKYPVPEPDRVPYYTIGGPDVTEDTGPGLTADKTHLSAVRNQAVADNLTAGPVGDSGADPVVPHIIVRPGDIWRIEMAAMLAAEGFTQSTGDIGDGFNPPGWVWEFTSGSEYDGRTLTVVVDPASLIIQNMEINGTPVPMISLTLPHTKPGSFDDAVSVVRGHLERVAEVMNVPVEDLLDRYAASPFRIVDDSVSDELTSPKMLAEVWEWYTGQRAHTVDGPRCQNGAHTWPDLMTNPVCQCGLIRVHDAEPASIARQAAPSITCPRCGRTSYNPNDVREQWCGNCSDYHPGKMPGWLREDFADRGEPLPADVVAKDAERRRAEAAAAERTRPPVYGPHCQHADLCSMFGCDQRGHIDYPCREQATCEYCGPGAVCPSSPSGRAAAECPECHVAPDDPPGGD